MNTHPVFDWKMFALGTMSVFYLMPCVLGKKETPISHFLGVIKGVNRVTRWFTPLFAEREGSGLLYKIIKDLYQIISKLSERQVVTDIIWYDILFIDNLGSNTS